MRRLFTAYFIAAIPCALAAQRAPGKGYTMVVTIDSGTRVHTMSTQMETMGAKFRMAGTSDAVADRPMEMIQIIDSIAGTMTVVMPAQSMVMISARAMLKAAIAAQTEFTFETGAGPKSQVVDLGPGEKILGYSTRRYRQTVTYTMKITVGSESCTKAHREESEIWATKEVQLPDLKGPMEAIMGTGAAPSSANALDSIRNQTIPGAVLRRISMTKTAGAAGDSLLVTTKTEVTAISKDSVDSHDFDIPTGYNVMDMSHVMTNGSADTFAASMQTEKARMRERLKQSLCGDGTGKP